MGKQTYSVSPGAIQRLRGLFNYTFVLPLVEQSGYETWPIGFTLYLESRILERLLGEPREVVAIFSSNALEASSRHPFREVFH